MYLLYDILLDKDNFCMNKNKYSDHRQKNNYFPRCSKQRVDVRVIGLRLHSHQSTGRTCCSKSVIWNVSLSSPTTETPVNTETASPNQSHFPCVGWEKNADGRLAPRFIDLSAAMDKKRLRFFVKYISTFYKTVSPFTTRCIYYLTGSIVFL